MCSNMNYNIFRHGTIHDVPYIISLVKKRIEWMDCKGISQWNKTHYLEHYPENYYIQAAQSKMLYVLESNSNNRIIASAVLLTEDPRWEQTEPTAFYIHNLVAAIGEHHAGEEIVRQIENLALQKGKRFVRLDCAINNDKLNSWYENLGYQFVGTITDGEYQGRLREKEL